MRKILIVEDDTIVRDYLLEILEADGFDVIAVGDGADAVERLEQSDIELILLDLIMPYARIDGMGLLSRLTSHAELKQTPIIILSAVGDVVKDALRPHIAQALQICAVIAKPFDAEDLLRTIRDIPSPRPR